MTHSTMIRLARRTLIAAAVGSLVLASAGSAVAAGPARAQFGPQVIDMLDPRLTPTLHPSGNDRLVEHGGSGTQGKAHADPDGLYNRGIDQFGHPGGLYLVDQDGNNGCGNDQDFEDDNNGNCGGGRVAPTCTTLGPVTTHGRSAAHRHAYTVPCDTESDYSETSSPSVDQLLSSTGSFFS